MPKQHTAATFAAPGVSQPRHSKRVRQATDRFVEGWYSVHLPSLSLALGVGVANGQEPNYAAAEGEASSSDDKEPLALSCQEDDETPDVTGEVREAAVVGVSEPRRLERVRKATDRFVEGWYSVRLPRLSSALGVAVADGKDR